MKKFIFIFVLCLFRLNSKAQVECIPGKVYNFQNQIDGFKSIVQLNNGEYIAGGSTWIPTAPGNYNMCFARIDACGDSIWTKLIGQNYESFLDADIYYKSGDDFVVSVSQHYNHITELYSYGMVKLSLDGDTIWLRKYMCGLSNSGPLDVIQTADGGFALVGFSQNFPNNYARIWFIKTDAEGNMEWDRYYGTNNNIEAAEHLLQLPDGGYLMLSRRIYSATDVVKTWLIRTNPQGDVLWERFYGNNFATYGGAIIPVFDGYMITGIQYAAPSWQVEGDAYILKTDTFGILQWERTYGGQYSEYLPKVLALSDGNYICAGNTGSFGTGGGSPDGWLFKINAVGDSLWSRTYRYEEPTILAMAEYLWDFAPAPEGGFMLAGFAGRLPPNNQDAWVIRTDSLGNPCPPDNGCWAVGVPQTPTLFEGACPDCSGGQGGELFVYPNPAQDLLHLQDWQNIAAFNLCSISGMVVRRYSPVTSSQIAIAELPAGLYIAEAQYKNGTTQRQKLLIHR